MSIALQSSQNVPEYPGSQKHLQHPFSASPTVPPFWQHISEQSAEMLKNNDYHKAQFELFVGKHTNIH